MVTKDPYKKNTYMPQPFEEKDADKTVANEEDKIVDDLDDTFGEGFGAEEEKSKDDAEEEGDDKGAKESEEEEKDEDKSKDKSSKKSSAIFQKQKYREQLKKALGEIEALKAKSNTTSLSDDEKKEQQANEFLAKKIEEVLTKLNSKKAEESSSAEEALQEELDEVLEENTDLSEEQVLDVCEEMDVTPKQAVKILERERKLKGKEKPKVPQAKRASPEVKETDEKKGKLPSFDEINRSVKDRIRRGLL